MCSLYSAALLCDSDTVFWPPRDVLPFIHYKCGQFCWNHAGWIKCRVSGVTVNKHNRSVSQISLTDWQLERSKLAKDTSRQPLVLKFWWIVLGWCENQSWLCSAQDILQISCNFLACVCVSVCVYFLLHFFFGIRKSEIFVSNLAEESRPLVWLE